MSPQKIIHSIETAIHWFIYGMVLFLFGREETIGKEEEEEVLAKTVSFRLFCFYFHINFSIRIFLELWFMFPGTFCPTNFSHGFATLLFRISTNVSST